MDAVLTVRMDARLKDQASAAIVQAGSSPSALVRDVFEYVVKTGHLPLIEERGNPSREEIEARIARFDAVHTKKPLALSDEELRQERMLQRYGE